MIKSTMLICLSFLGIFVLFTNVSAQTTSNERILYRVARIISDTSLYSEKIKDVLPKFDFLDLVDMENRNCPYRYGWIREKISLHIRFCGWSNIDSLLQQIMVEAKDIKSPVVDSINKIIQKVFINPPDTSFGQGWKSYEYKHQSTNSTIIIDVTDKFTRVMLSANTPEEEY